MEDLLKTGAHFGHKISKWHPNMAPYIYTSRNEIHIIDLSKTVDMLAKAVEFIQDEASKGKTVLLVGTKKSMKNIIKDIAEEAGIPYVNERWLGGTITNFSTIRQLVDKLVSLENRKNDPDYETKYTKKERLVHDREIAKINNMVGGIRNLKKIPDVLYIIDVKSEKTAVKEANKRDIPVVAITDTNVDLTLVDYPIPANDDSIKTVRLITETIVEAIKAGQTKAGSDKDAGNKEAKEDKEDKKETKEEKDK